MTKSELMQLVRDNLPLVQSVDNLSEVKDYINNNPSNEGYIIIVPPSNP